MLAHVRIDGFRCSSCGDFKTLRVTLPMLQGSVCVYVN